MQKLPSEKLSKILVFPLILSGLAVVLGEYFTLSASDALQYFFRTVFWVFILLYLALRLSSRKKH